MILYLDHLERDPNYLEDNLEDLFMYENVVPDLGNSQKGSSGVVIEELPDSPTKPKSSVKIVELEEEAKPWQEIQGLCK